MRGWLRTHRTLFVVGVVIVLAAGAWFGWDRFEQSRAHSAAAKVTATWSPVCNNSTKLTTVRDFGTSAQAIESTPGWSCTLELNIVNESDRTVRVPRIYAPYVGAGGAGEVVGRSTSSARIHDDSTENHGPFGDRDAVFDVRLVIPAGHERTVKLGIGWREEGCASGPAVFGIGGWPILLVETGNRNFHRPAENSLVLKTFDD